MAKDNSDHWSEYWSRGCLTSLPEDFAANYDGEVAEFWRDAFRSVPAGGSVIDLCTGNGAIALLAAEHTERENRDLKITAVDAATVNTRAIAEKFPATANLLARIHFIDNCRIEDLDLPDAQFDLATSQYGIEYCDWEPAARQICRILKPGGRLVIVTHTATSDILKFMEREQEEYQLLEQLDFFSAIRDYLDDRISHGRFRAVLANAQSRLGAEFSRSASPLFRSVLGMLGGALQMDQTRLDQGRPHLESYYAQTRYGYERLNDMLRVNHAIGSDPDWYRVFEAAGLMLEESGEIRYRGAHHAGGYFVFARPVEG